MSERIYSPKHSANEYRLDSWMLDVHSNCLRKAEQKVDLEHRLVILLLYFIDHPGEVLIKERILKAIWPGKVVNEDSLAVAISQLRKALGDNSRAPRFIKTIPGLGYQFIAQAQPVIPEPSAPAPLPDNPASEAPASLLMRPRWLVFAVLLSLAVLTAVNKLDHRAPVDEQVRALAQEQLGSGKPEDWRQAVGNFRRLLDQNPQDAQAYLGIAQAKIKLLGNGLVSPGNCAEVKGLLARALELDPLLSAAWLERGNILFWCARDHAEAEASYQQAIRLRPADDQGPMQYAQWLLAQGRFAESLQQMQKSQQLNPLNYSKPMVIWIYQMQRRNDLAYAEWERITRAEPENRFYHISAQRVLASLGKAEESFGHLQWLMKDAGYSQDILTEFAQAFAQGGLAAVYHRLLMDKDQADLGQYTPPLSWARYALLAGEQELALEYLEQAAEQQQLPLLWAAVDPAYDSLRDHPRFQAVVAALAQPLQPELKKN